MFCFSPPKFINYSFKPYVLDDTTTNKRSTVSLTPITKTRSMPLMRQRPSTQDSTVLRIDDLITSLSPPSLAEDLSDYPPKDVAKRLSRRIHIHSRSSSWKQQQQTQQDSTVKPENEQSTTEIPKPITPPPPPVFKFERLDDSKVIQQFKKEHRSLLTEHVYTVRRRRKSSSVSVFFPTTIYQEPLHKCTIRLDETDTGIALILKTINQYKLNTGKEPIHYDPNAFFIRVAEDSGKVDTDWPALEPTSLIHKTGSDSIVLVYKTDHPISKEDYLKRRRRKSRKSVSGKAAFLRDIRLHVRLPGSTETKLVPIAPDMLTIELLRVLMRRFNLDADKHTVKYFVGDELRNLMPEMLSKTFFVLGITHVAIIRTVEEDVTERREKRVESIVMPDLKNMPYMEYRVIKINKFGARQERVLGINETKIINKVPTMSQDKKSFLGLSRQRSTKRPERLISTLVRIDDYPDKPKDFSLHFAEGDIWYYEAETKVEAAEIVRTLRHLLKLNSQEKLLPSSWRKSYRKSFNV